MEYRAGVGRSFGFIRSFDLNQEGNLATWFSVALLFVNALVFAVIAGVWRGQRGGRAWAGLALLFLAMSVEEGAALHEMTVLPLRNLLNAGGLLYYTWVLPGIVFVLCVAAAYLPFLARLPARTRNLLVLAGAVYVTGAIGVEMLGGRHAALHGVANFGYALLAHLEESLEIAGLVVLLYTLLDYVGRYEGPITLRIAPATVHEFETPDLVPADASTGGEVRRSAPVMPTAANRPASHPVSPR
jgi:hypothetical protein